MNIITPIITNAIILAILIAGIFVGKKNGFKIQLGKLLFLLPSCVGLYFLNPITTDLVSQISLINNLLVNNIVSFTTLTSIVLLLEFLIVYAFICLVMSLFRHNKKNKKEIGVTAKPLKGISRKKLKEVRKEEKKLKKLQKKQFNPSKKSKVFGAIIGFIISLLVAFVVMIPSKYIVKDIVNVEPKLADLNKGYEYTIYGQLDKVTDIVEFIVEEK